jgi:outer membrane biosynthesis protein TonB
LCPVTTADAGIALQTVAFVPGAHGPTRRGGRADERVLVRSPMVSVRAQQDASPRSPVRVGGDVSAPRLITSVFPACPGHVDGRVVVIMEGTVASSGAIADARVLQPADGTAPPAPEFVAAALDAVRQWTYTPARLNGRPVPAIVRIAVVFSQQR